MRRVLRFAVVVGLLLATGGAVLAGGAAMTLSSPAFRAGGALPAHFTCDERNVSPPLAWSGVPAATTSLVMVMDDPDAPNPAASKAPTVHWALYDIPPALGELPDSLDASGLPPGVRAGRNDFGKAAWEGPCPRSGKHRYVFRLYALDTFLYDLGQPTRAKLDAAMKGHVLAKAEMTVTYQKTPD